MCDFAAAAPEETFEEETRGSCVSDSVEGATEETISVKDDFTEEMFAESAARTALHNKTAQIWSSTSGECLLA